MSETRTARRFWIVSSNRWNSAVTEYALSCAAALHQAGQHVVFTPLAGSAAEERAVAAGLPVHSLAAFGASSLFKFRAIAKVVRPDVTIVMAGAETFLAKFVRGKIVRVWGEAARAPETIAGWRGKAAFSHCAAFITPSDVVGTELARHTAKRIVTLPLGIDPKRFYRQEALGGFLQKRPQIVLLGRFDPVKGHERAVRILADAFRRWRDHQRRPCLHIVGEPANLSETDIKDIVTQNGLVVGEDVLITAKRVSQPHQLMSQAILGLISSTGSELICRVGQEFLMCGTSVVVSGVGSLNEILFDDSAGASYQNVTSDADIATLLMHWVDKSLTEGELAKRKRAQLAQKRFGLPAMATQLAAIVDNL